MTSGMVLTCLAVKIMSLLACFRIPTNGMSFQLTRFTFRQWCTSFVVPFLLCTFFAQTTSAQSVPQPPSQVSALVYSASAAELFWTPTGERVQVSRNGQVLTELDARSLFQSDLSASDTYHYELRTINASGETSAAVFVSLSTRNFSLPVKRVYPIGQDSNAAPPPPQDSFIESTAGATQTNSDSNDNGDATVAINDANTLVANEPLNDGEAANTNSTSDIVQTSNNCIARDISSLSACVRNADSYARIDIANNIQCTDNCCPNGTALLKFNQVSNLDIAGHGHRIQRSQGHRQCGLLEINNSSGIRFNALRLDDDQQVPGCQVAENCPRMVYIKHASQVSFVDTHVSHGKGYAFYVQGTNGFRFERGVLHNSGVLGMYIGHGDDASTNVHITQSTFSDNQTNGLALLGVTGQSLTTNLVADNLFVRNHRKGQWAVAPRYGSGFTGGGQLYVAQASNVTVRNNVVKDGYCDNCFVQRKNRSGVSGIELGRPNQQSVNHVEVSGNRVLNLDGFGISQNANSALTNNVTVRNNVLLNTGSGEALQGAQKSGNRILNTQQFDSFESGSDLAGASGGRFKSAVHCSSNSSVARQCGVASRNGQCVAQLALGSASCSDARVQLTGPSTNINPGQLAVLTGWVRSPRGRWCAEFRDYSGNWLSEQCAGLDNVAQSDVQQFVGLPAIEAVAPSGVASVQLRLEHQHTGAAMWVDDLKLSVGGAN